MVNPGVIFLAQKEIDKDNFCIEDNIGESIHVHWGHVRLDLTIKELIALTEQLSDAMNSMMEKPGFDIRNADINYLYDHADMMASVTSNAEKCMEDEIRDAYKDRENQILMCMDTIIPIHLKKKNVVLKGAGEHTRELIKRWKDKVNIVGILSNDKGKVDGYAALEYGQLSEFDVDTIVISSYRYRHEMMKDIEENTKSLEIIDLYQYLEYLGVYGIEKEFYRYIKDGCQPD